MHSAKSPPIEDYILGVERSATIDASGLDEQDRQAVQMMVERLREKNKS